MAFPTDLAAHLATGTTTVCRCWALIRSDGQTYGFTDHDRSLAFDGISFRADAGMTARAVQQSTGLSVDNSEALGILSDPAVRETDIEAGRFDGAEVRAWLVNWRDVTQRVLQFRGHIGEIARTGSAFRAELRGLADRLNQPRGRVYQSGCGAVLGDPACRFDMTTSGYFIEGPVESVSGNRVITLAADGFAAHWFARGRVTILSGAAAGTAGIVKNDDGLGGIRRIELWETPRAPIVPGDSLRVEAGCDKRADTCRTKFGNFLNFRGFPNIPGEDWLVAYPRRDGVNDGGSFRG